MLVPVIHGDGGLTGLRSVGPPSRCQLARLGVLRVGCCTCALDDSEHPPDFFAVTPFAAALALVFNPYAQHYECDTD